MPPTTSADMDAFFERSAQQYASAVPFVRDFARDALRLLPAIGPEAVVHDNACGPGIVTGAILQQNGPTSAADAGPARIHATDLSAAMIRTLQGTTALQDPCVNAEVMDMTALRFGDGTFSHSLTSFALMLIGDEAASKAAREIYRTLQPGGSAIATTWKELGYVAIFDEVLAAVRPGVTVSPDVPIAAPWRKADRLVDTLVGAGFERENVSVHQFAHDVPTGLQGVPEVQAQLKQMIVGKILQEWSQEDKDKFEDVWQRRLQREKEAPTTYTMVAHIAVAKK